jgi:hypothetical protein
MINYAVLQKCHGYQQMRYRMADMQILRISGMCDCLDRYGRALRSTIVRHSFDAPSQM